MRTEINDYFFSQIVGCVSSILQYYGLASVPLLLGIASDMCAALCSASLAIALLFIHARADQTLSSVQPALIVLPWGLVFSSQVK